MRRLLPHPITAGILLVFWLLLNQSLSPGQFLLGAIIAVIASHALAALQPERVRIGSGRAILRLVGIVVSDIVRSNFAVARIVLSRRKRVSGFLRIPLDLRNSNGLAVLGCVITATPGTTWVQYDRANNMLLIHVLDLVDEETWIRLIKQRYEKLLMAIFP